MKRMGLFCCAVVIGLLTVTVLAQAPRRMQLDDLGRIVRVSDPQIAPDGKSIVVVVARANYEDNRWENELVLVDVATGAQRVLTNGRHDVTQPRWSPQGDRLAFIASAATGKETKPQ